MLAFGGSKVMKGATGIMKKLEEEGYENLFIWRDEPGVFYENLYANALLFKGEIQHTASAVALNNRCDRL
jgi:hypothetical protein